MHSDLLEMSQAAREEIEAPPFPLAAIRAAMDRSVERASRRRSIVAVVLAGFSIAAIAAAAEVSQQARLRFVPSGGLVISSDVKGTHRAVRTDSDVRDAAGRLGFRAVLPAGLPSGTKPIKIDAFGKSMLVVTYALLATKGEPEHKLWVFLADPAAVSNSNAPAAALYQTRKGYTVDRWRAGPEQVIVVSDGLSKSGVVAIKSAMTHGQ